MAKRKRLTPATITASDAHTGPLETKGLKNGWAGTQVHSGSPTPPIADVAGSAAAAAALEELAHEMQSARASGRMVVKADLSTIDESYLVRDRAGLDPVEMQALTTSLRERGQQTPIEVVDLGDGRLGLISGWRRLTALKALHADDAQGGFGHIQCLIRAPETSSDAYIAMVEENEIRAGLSFYERARIAARAAERGAFASPRAAAKALFGSVARAKRSKIYSFLDIYAHLDDVLTFPAALSEKLGLQLAKALSEGQGRVAYIRAGLSDAQIKTAQDEVDALKGLLLAKLEPKEAQPAAETDGIKLSVGRNKLTLTGAGVTSELESQLRAWLADLPS
jgi:ParB family chromosome partitioning protein